MLWNHVYKNVLAVMIIRCLLSWFTQTMKILLQKISRSCRCTFWVLQVLCLQCNYCCSRVWVYRWELQLNKPCHHIPNLYVSPLHSSCQRWCPPLMSVLRGPKEQKQPWINGRYMCTLHLSIVPWQHKFMFSDAPHIQSSSLLLFLFLDCGERAPGGH